MTSYLIAGAGRAIGAELVNQLSQLSSTSTVYVGVRNPSAAPESFSSNSKVHIVQLDVLRQSDVDAAVETVRKTTSALDVLIVNAAGATNGFVAQCSTEQIQEPLELNNLAPHRLVQAFPPLVRAGTQKKIIAMGTAGGPFAVARSLARKGVPSGGYGISKAALHFMVMLYAADLTTAEGILFASVDSGVVDSPGAREFMKKNPKLQGALEASRAQMISPRKSVEAVLKVVERLSEERSGDFLSNEGEVLPF